MEELSTTIKYFGQHSDKRDIYAAGVVSRSILCAFILPYMSYGGRVDFFG